ncbi:MAG: hypothetical protein Ct9H300mP28_36340 [Pseudomonadota bacterium]|nr:MAG: hypothetical protein Ct9H300mP28_36340 [Pseudomonadota bacterium]
MLFGRDIVHYILKIFVLSITRYQVRYHQRLFFAMAVNGELSPVFETKY